MIEIKIIVDVEVHNHAEIVRSQKGGFWGSMASNPVGGFLINPQVDLQIKEQLQETLRKELPGTLGSQIQKGLSEKGVRASVSIRVP